jgi:hypothetical protein
MHDPHGAARYGQLGGEVPVRGDLVEVLAAHPDRVASPVLLEVLDQVLLVPFRRLGRSGTAPV